ncbi:MAG: ribonuclease III [OM182 bacterium MED-G28]|uniref:Ribonuclease 3 n=1 Tax=OM182 bacterium MED-G28 TaxID=1986256 RepID=A0A2A5WG37_9GAMM|nr:MAG: ribonuclease III [OM182 bacterium MED-G28]
MAIDLDKLQQLLNHKFSDPDLVRLALTHRSANKLNNERLEFLGDSLLGYIVAEILFEIFPQANEGELSRLRAMLVNKTTLAEIAREIDLKNFIQLGSGEKKSGGDNRDSILADAIEALIAAIYLDGGINSCKSLIEDWIADRIATESVVEQQKDAKTKLQEMMQAQGLSLPFYSVLEISGEAHEQNFLVECRVDVMTEPQKGTGSSKRNAEQQAANVMLTKLKALT